MPPTRVAEVVIRAPRERLMQGVDFLTLLEAVQERRERPHVDRGRAQPQQMTKNAVELHEDDAYDLAPLRHLDAHELFYGHHVRAVVDQRREIVHSVRKRDDLIPRPVLTELLEGRVQVADVRDDACHRFAIELTDKPKNAMRRRVLRANVDEHLLGAELRLRNVEGRQGARRA